MSYAAGDLRPGDAILDWGHVPIDRAIEHFTLGPSHCAMVGNGCLIEAVWPLVAEAPLDKYVATARRYSPIDVTDEQRQGAVAAARTRLGQPYGVHALLLAAERHVLRIPVTEGFDPKDLDCSCLYVWAWWQQGYVVTYEPEPSPASVLWSPRMTGERPWLARGA